MPLLKIPPTGPVTQPTTGIPPLLLRPMRRGREREPEEEDNTLTLSQYLAQKKEIEGVPKLDARKANEGVDDNIWKDVVPLKKDEEGNSYFVGKVIISGLLLNFL
jgi:plasminogen activator inhibitor 1 RNA-binding protein